jgi:phospholipid/cholesterol/gamma-HCH transport system permease protein
VNAGPAFAPALRAAARLADTAAVGVAIIGHTITPGTWRRTVRAEFVRFLDIAGVQSLAGTSILAVVVGLSLVAQATYWLERVGDPDLVRSVISTILVREIAPLLVGLLVVGRGGFEMLNELIAANRGGVWRALRAGGIDPFLLLVVPRALALAVSMFCLAVVFIVVSLCAAYLAARAAELTTRSPGEFALGVLQSVGGAGYLMLPVKAVLTGLGIGAVCAVTALHESGTTALRHGLARAVLVVLVVSGTVSAVL